MREILFRGKALHDGEWYTGWYLPPCEMESEWNSEETIKAPACIQFINDKLWPDFVEIHPETGGQYTGLTDKNGRKIFEGDVVEAVLPPTQAQKEFNWGKMVVVFCDAAFGLKGHRKSIPFGSFAPRVEFTVIGNIHDTPELLDGGDINGI